MRGRKPRYVAGSAGFWVAPPPITREEASAIVGEIDAGTWRRVESLYTDMQGAVALAEQAFRDVKEDGAARSYPAMREAVEKDLLAALGKVQQVLNDNAAVSAIDTWSQGYRARQEELEDIRDLLNPAVDLLSRAVVRVRVASPPAASGMLSPAGAKARFVRDLWDCLSAAGMACETSGGGSYAAASMPAMKPFEQLVAAFNVHRQQSPGAFLRWVHRALTK